MNVKKFIDCEMIDLVFLLDCYRNEIGLGNNEIEWK